MICSHLVNRISVAMLMLQPCIHVLVSGALEVPSSKTEWLGWGANAYNNRWASDNTQLNSSSVGDLVQHCRIRYPLGVSATPVISKNIAYYPSSNGSFNALHIGNCEYKWQINVTDIIYSFAEPNNWTESNCLPLSRTSPQIDDDVLYFSTQMHALLVAVDLETGAFLANVQVNDHELAICTQSPTVYNGQIFQGVSSQEETAVMDPAYPCCNFVGTFKSYTFDRVKKAFAQKWVVYTMPRNSGWAGGTVWGSQPSIDPTRNQVFIGTGNTYRYAKGYAHCVNETSDCLPDDVWQESIIALDIDTGVVNWRESVSPLDVWVMSCGYANAPVSASPICPGRPGPDADFGMAPVFVPAALGAGTSGFDSIVVGQKNGNLCSFNAETGDITWQISTSPGVLEAGGMSWGIAVDNASIYYTAINYGGNNWTISPSGLAINNSAWGSTNLRTGEIAWNTPVPNNLYAYTPPGVVNDVIFVGQGGSDYNHTTTNPGSVVALAKSSGAILRSWEVDSVQRGGIAISGGFIIFGSGYHYDNPFQSGSLYIYGLPDAIKAAQAETTSSSEPLTSQTNFPASGNEPGVASSSPVAKKNAASRRAYTRPLVVDLSASAVAYCVVLLVLPLAYS